MTSIQSSLFKRVENEAAVRDTNDRTTIITTKMTIDRTLELTEDLALFRCFFVFLPGHDVGPEVTTLA